MLGRLRDRGYDLVADAHQADVIVVNTCAFIDRAKQESVDTILEMAKEKETGRAQRLVVTGCLTQRYDAELRREIPEIDATLGTGQVDDIVKAVEGDASVDASEAPTWVYDHAAPRILSTPPWLAYVKISEGCDYTCSFCIIPTLRGRHRSRNIEDIVAEVRGLEERIHVAEKDLVALRHDLLSAEEEMARLQRKEAVLATERAQAEQERGAAAVRLAEIELALTTAESDRDEGSRRLAALTTAVAEARAASEAAQVRTSEAKSVLAALRERAAATEAECRRLEQDHRDLLGRIAAAEQRAAEMDARREELRAEMAEAERLLTEALAARERVGSEASVAEDRVRDLRNELEGREAGLKERRRERDMLRDALGELEVAQARTGSDLDHLGRECHQAVAMMAAEAAALITDEDRAQDLSGLEVQIQEMRDRLDRMGPVNVLAVEQSQELEERSTFLTAQRQDLLDSIADLDQAIKKIDRASRERFQEAFQVINQHFGEIFRQLFGGGTAGLALIDEEDLLESGIDVMAQPPGKRLQNVMLLSGGEKALTAISLLFAIFQYKPSPFCILDEVDAPLDDANIGRFIRMLEGLKEQTQFVLITHSRKSMEIADQLYGVTMEEPGVSKLVSVRLS